MDKSVDLRFERKENVDKQLLQWLLSKGETGATPREMAEHFKFNYHTARNHLLRLMGEKKVELSPTIAKATYYRAVHYGGMPMLSEDVSLWDYVQAFANPQRVFPATERTRHVLLAFAQLFSYAERYANGGSVSRKQIQETRETLIASKAKLQELSQSIDIVLNTRDLWHSNESLKKALLEDPNHLVSTSETSTMYSNHATRYESATGTI